MAKLGNAHLAGTVNKVELDGKHGSGKQAAIKANSQGPTVAYHGKLANEVNTTMGAKGKGSSTKPDNLPKLKDKTEGGNVKTSRTDGGKTGKINDNQHGNKSAASILYPT